VLAVASGAAVLGEPFGAAEIAALALVTGAIGLTLAGRARA
jgi:drug/metabolite transporter (DMT)-like permease